jgi:cysteine desulfurase
VVVAVFKTDEAEYLGLAGSIPVHLRQLPREPMTSRLIYLDYNATTPADPRVVAAMHPYFGQHFGNPSSLHTYGREPASAVALARGQVAKLIGATPEEIVFTASGSEADHLAVLGVARARRADGNHVITQATEHPALLSACSALAAQDGTRVTVLPVDGHGLVSADDLHAAMTPDTVLVSIMHANNETGSVQHIRELAAIAHAGHATFHTDAAQSAGKIPIDVSELGVDLLTLVGHKLHAPKGIAALYVRRGTSIAPLICGGGQERGLRAGTENVPYIVALGAACNIAGDEGVRARDAIARLRDLLHHQLENLLPGRVVLNGHPTYRLPNTLNVSIVGTRGDRVLTAAAGLAASTGAACHDDNLEPSPVLTAMGVDGARASAALRLSLGRTTSLDEVEAAATLLAAAVAEVSGDSARIVHRRTSRSCESTR